MEQARFWACLRLYQGIVIYCCVLQKYVNSDVYNDS